MLHKDEKKIQNEYISRNTILLIVILLAGLIVRLFTYPQVIENYRIVFLEAYPYYHMWRVFSYIDTFPKTFNFDGYLNYPYGTFVGWPPLFDQVTALVSIILGFGKPEVHLVETIGAFMPVALGIFYIVTVFFIARDFFNERTALFGALLIAVIPAHVQISFLGFTDHHIAEVLISIMAYMFFIRSLNNGSLASAIMSGIMIGISFLTWQGAPIFTGILLFYAIIQFIFDRRTNTMSNYLVFTGAVSFLSAVLVLAIFYIWTPWQHSITSGVLSYFQPFYLIISAIIIILSGLISNLVKERKWYYYPFLLITLFSFIFVLIITFAPTVYQSISGGIGYLLRDVHVLKQISEAQPLFYTFDGKFLGWQFFNNPVWDAFTLSFYSAIAGLLWFLYSFRKGMDKGKLFFAVWSLIILVLALFQRRFAYMLAVNVAILSGFFIDEILQKSMHKFLPGLIYILVFMLLVIPNKFRQGNQVVLKGTFMAVASFADKDLAMYLDKNNLPNRNYVETMYARMHVFDGNSLWNYRMIYESEENHYDLFDKPTKNINIFEYLKGAKITGKASCRKQKQTIKDILNLQCHILRIALTKHDY